MFLVLTVQAHVLTLDAYAHQLNTTTAAAFATTIQHVLLAMSSATIALALFTAVKTIAAVLEKVTTFLPSNTPSQLQRVKELELFHPTQFRPIYLHSQMKGSKLLM